MQKNSYGGTLLCVILIPWKIRNIKRHISNIFWHCFYLVPTASLQAAFLWKVIKLYCFVHYSEACCCCWLVPNHMLLKILWNTKKIFCLTAVTIGAILISGVSLQHGANIIGILCALMCAFSYVGMILFNKKSTAVTGLANSSIQLTSGFLTALIYNLIRWMSGNAPAMTIHHHEWIPILILRLINTGVGCYLYFSSISEIPAQTVAVCDYIEPLSAVLLAAIVLHGSMILPQIGGAILIIGGTMLWNLPFQKDIQ